MTRSPRPRPGQKSKSHRPRVYNTGPGDDLAARIKEDEDREKRNRWQRNYNRREVKHKLLVRVLLTPADTALMVRLGVIQEPERENKIELGKGLLHVLRSVRDE